MEPDLGLRTLDQEQDALNFNRLMEGDTDMFWVHDLERPFNKDKSSHALVMRLPFNGHTPYGAIVIYIDPSKPHVIRNSENLSFLLDDHGHVIGESGMSRKDAEGDERDSGTAEATGECPECESSAVEGSSRPGCVAGEYRSIRKNAAKLDLCLRHAAIENHCSNEAVYSYHPDLLCFCACGITGCKLVCL